MKCPCGSPKTRVTSTIASSGKNLRKRKCPKCGRNSVTEEIEVKK